MTLRDVDAVGGQGHEKHGGEDDDFDCRDVRESRSSGFSDRGHGSIVHYARCNRLLKFWDPSVTFERLKLDTSFFLC